ncbi:SLAM family member 5 isoform X2 [Pipistrellus kuhlii]|uniref:SLAM family member 5 isoform X2 n=1 Tax=Pipistrellus kuhlii TaxID=59472 RepID=UPI00174F3F72|nr:SLAM family member 5 isoform X2 [Pipistrellus kuhlii]
MPFFSQSRILRKMAQHYLWILLLCLQTCLEAAESNTNILTVSGILGETVTFPLNIQDVQQVSTINWRNSKTSVAVVVAHSNKPPQVLVTHQYYNQRINVSSQNYNLEISNLRMEDSETYKADINTDNSEKKTFTRTYKLQVYRRLGKPKITQSLMTSENSTCNVTLTCSVEKEEENVTYRWSPTGKEGSVLQIFQIPKNQELIYTCTAWNPVSNNSDSISAQQLCADSSFKILKSKKKPDDVSKNTIYTCVTAPKDPQPAELRIYDEISLCKMDKTVSTQGRKPPGISSYESVI